jgi:hypothetical protein
MVLSSFHDVETSGIAIGNSVVAAAKWNYVEGVVRVSITPLIAPNGTSHVKVMLPNGTSVNLLTPREYTFTVHLPRTGDVFGNGAISGPYALTESQPLNVTLSQNVGDITSFVGAMEGATKNSILPIDLYVFVIYGEAQVSITGFGMGL